ncbi:VOC family protein [Microbacterium sp. CFBP9034]|uniref:bleomycin resistance protein n=1 Tax=Microbacterium sp. CFBP9034 TaxID=3096540 RepID=UPI002A69AD4B|nr:VOC family protein [Microbacterium sp. CFBP9034]MDY0910569.1 VOC family protein [Microbacterium sp. CFBP9034]
MRCPVQLPETSEWDYLILGRGEAELHFMAEPSVGPLRTAGSAYVFVDDADGLFHAWSAAVVADDSTASRVTDLMDTDYGMREFAVVDSSGNLIRVGSAL